MQLGIVNRLFGSALTPDAEAVSQEGEVNAAAAFAAILSALRPGTARCDVAHAHAETVDAEPGDGESVGVETADADPVTSGEDEAAELLFNGVLPGVTAPRVLQLSSETQESVPAEPTHTALPASEGTSDSTALPTVPMPEESLEQGGKDVDASAAPSQHEELLEGAPQETRNTAASTSHTTPIVPPQTTASDDAGALDDAGAGSRDPGPGANQPDQPEFAVAADVNQVLGARGRDVAATMSAGTETGVERTQSDNRPDSGVSGETNVEAEAGISIHASGPDEQGSFYDENGSGGSKHEKETDRVQGEIRLKYADDAPSQEEESGSQLAVLGGGEPNPHTLETGGVSLPVDTIGESAPFEIAPSLDSPVLADALPEAQQRADISYELESPAPAREQLQSLFARPATAAAWIRSMLAQQGHEAGLVEGWQVLNIKLDDDQGSVTVRARREEEKVSISVGFTDPGTRAMVQANAQRIEQTLEAQYQTSVDLSFFTGSNEQGGTGGDPGQGKDAGSGKALLPSPPQSPVVKHRPKPATALREWVV